jgi:hypothetical protein
MDSANNVRRRLARGHLISDPLSFLAIAMGEAVPRDRDAGKANRQNLLTLKNTFHCVVVGRCEGLESCDHAPGYLAMNVIPIEG